MSSGEHPTKRKSIIWWSMGGERNEMTNDEDVSKNVFREKGCEIKLSFYVRRLTTSLPCLLPKVKEIMNYLGATGIRERRSWDILKM